VIACPRDDAATDAAVLGEVVRLAAPATAQLVLGMLVFVAERALVARVSTTALASLHVATAVSFAATSVLGAIGAGALAVVGRRLGEGDREGARAAARSAHLAAAALGIGMTVALVAAGDGLIRALFPRADAGVIEGARAYLAIALSTLPLAGLEVAAAACLQAAGDTRTPLAIALGAHLASLVVGVTLVLGPFGAPALGLRGAALGAAAAMAIQGVALPAILFSRRGPLGSGAARCSGERAARGGGVARLAAATLVERAIYHAAYLAHGALIGLFGTGAMAAHQAILGLESAGCQVADGLGVAAGALTARRLGEGRPEAARAAARTAAWLGVAILALGAIGLAAAPRRALALVGGDADVLDLAVAPLWLACLAQPPMALAVVLTMAARGAGDARTPLAATLLATVVMRLGVTWLVGHELGLGLVGAWLGCTADWTLRAALLVGARHRGARA
jgi:putative MATE family efflux protein